MRRQVTVIWDLEDDADGNYVHIVIEHDQARNRLRRSAAHSGAGTRPARGQEEKKQSMNKTGKLPVGRQTAPRAERTSEELAELRAVRERFQREKPSLEQVLAATGQVEATTLGEYFQARELLLALAQERQRQTMTLAALAKKTGYDPAVLSRLFTGRQANPTLATVVRIANALGKTVVHTLRDLPSRDRARQSAKASHTALPANGKTRRGPRSRSAAP